MLVLPKPGLFLSLGLMNGSTCTFEISSSVDCSSVAHRISQVWRRDGKPQGLELEVDQVNV